MRTDDSRSYLALATVTKGAKQAGVFPQDEAVTRPMRDRAGSLVTILAEYRRAIAAARRYQELKHVREPLAPRCNTSRRIFEEFYARTDVQITVVRRR